MQVQLSFVFTIAHLEKAFVFSHAAVILIAVLAAKARREHITVSHRTGDSTQKTVIRKETQNN